MLYATLESFDPPVSGSEAKWLDREYQCSCDLTISEFDEDFGSWHLRLPPHPLRNGS